MKRKLTAEEFDALSETGVSLVPHLKLQTARRGGKRPGPGRKPTGHVRVQLLISPATRDRLDELARRRRTTRSQVVEELAAQLPTSDSADRLST